MGLLDELERARDEREARRAAFRDSALAALQNAEDAQAAHAAWTRIATNLADCLTDPADIAPLRQTIIQLAVRGRLVPQDPGDEPVENLTASAAKELKAINAQKRTKTVADRPEYERDDPLPNGWAWVALQEIAQFIDYRGKTPKKTKSGVRLYTAKNIRPGRIVTEPAEFVSPSTYKTWMTRGFPIRGDVLFTTEAPMGNAAVIDEAVEPVFALAQRTICIHPVGGMDGRYLMNMMLSPWFKAELASRATGMTATGIKAAKLRLIRVPVPPVAEQHRIVAKVNELMAVCDELEQQLTEAKAHQSAFAAAAVHHLDLTPDLSAPLPDDPDPWPQPTPEQIDRVLAHLPDLRGDRARLAADRLWQDLSPNKMFVPFDWGAWKAGHAIVNLEPGWREQVAKADTKAIQRLFTTLIRSNAFCEGVWESAVDGGLVAELLERLAEIRGSM